jgi:ligand-binding sensor domain-containing protein
MKMVIRFFSVFILFASVSCSSESPSEGSVKPSGAEGDTSQISTPSSLKSFEPDANWTHPTEVVSQYGPSGIVRDVVVDQKGIIWLAAWDGIISFDGKQFTNHTLKDGLSHHRVYSVMEDSKGNMWFGTMGAGAYKFDGTKFTNLSSDNGMIDNVVFDLFEDMLGNMWFATPKGVSRYDGKSFMNLDSANSLRGEIYAISEDMYRIMWFGGEQGLFRYNDTDLVEVLTDYNTSYMNTRDLCLDDTGTMWVGSAHGLYNYSWDFTYMQPIKVDGRFTGYVNHSRNADLLLSSDGIYRYNTTVYQPHESPANRWTTVVADKSTPGIFGAREAADGTIWYGAMDGLHFVWKGNDVACKKP